MPSLVDVAQKASTSARRSVAPNVSLTLSSLGQLAISTQRAGPPVSGLNACGPGAARVRQRQVRESGGARTRNGWCGAEQARPAAGERVDAPCGRAPSAAGR
jgi:hypothetical protein